MKPAANPQPLADQATTSRARRRFGWRVKLIAIALGLIVGLVTAELVLRIYVAARGWTPNCYAMALQMYRPHPTIGGDLRPNFRFKSAVFDISFNSLGLRGDEISVENKPRIAVLGGSGAFGYFVSDQETKTHLLEVMFDEAGCPVEVINAGVPGYNLHHTIVRFNEVVAPLKPDYVLLYLGWNDGTYIVSDDPDSARYSTRWAPTSWQYAMSHSTLYGLIWSRWPSGQNNLVPLAGTNVIPTTAGKNRFRENLSSLRDAVAASGAQLIVCTMVQASHAEVPEEMAAFLSNDPQRLEELITLGAWTSRTLQEFANESDAEFIDAYNEIPPSTEVLGDAIHLTAQGERRLAEVWFRHLQPLICPDEENHGEAEVGLTD